MYTIDPRGLVGGPDLDETKLDMMDWQDHIRETQSSLRVIAELTGGFAVVNQNDFDKALKRIDAETSDYYVFGYYSSNPDPLKKRRNIEIKVKTAGKYDLNYKPSYTLKPPPAVKSLSEVDRATGRPHRRPVLRSPLHHSCYTFCALFQVPFNTLSTWRNTDEIAYQGRLEPRGRALSCAAAA